MIAGVAVLTAGSDMGQVTPMNEQIHDRHGCYPKEVLVDGGFAKHEDIETCAAQGAGCQV